MFFFLKLAWGNIFKDVRSSLTILIAVFISVFFMMLTYGYMDGFKLKMVDDALKADGHVKIYNSEFYGKLDFAPIEYNMEWPNAVEKELTGMPEVTGIRPEINYGCIASSETDSQDCFIKAIDYTNKYGLYDKRKNSIIEGSFIAADDEVVLGYKAAKMLKVKTGDKIIMMTMDSYGSMSAVEVKICGIANGHNPPEDEGLILCSLGAAQKLLAIGNAVTEVIVNVSDIYAADKMAARLNEQSKGKLKAVSWRTEQPIIEMSLGMLDVSTFIIAAIIVFIAGLGIINSFLMNIMGRLPDFGMLRAMGLGKGQLFAMIISESFLLGVIGTVAGILPACALVYYFQLHPISYETMGDMLNGMGGIDALIGMAVLPSSVMLSVFTGIFISVLASLYPAYTAVTKKPVDILRVLE